MSAARLAAHAQLVRAEAGQLRFGTLGFPPYTTMPSGGSDAEGRAIRQDVSAKLVTQREMTQRRVEAEHALYQARIDLQKAVEEGYVAQTIALRSRARLQEAND